MVAPLWILATLSIVGGLLSLPHAIWHGWSLSTWLHSVIPEVPGTLREIPIALNTEIAIAAISTVVAFFGFAVARSLYKVRELHADQQLELRYPAIARAIENKWYVDELYAAIIVRPLEALSRFFWKGIDALIDGLAAFLGFAVRGFGDVMRFFQTGNVRNYALMFFLGVVVFLVFLR